MSEKSGGRKGRRGTGAVTLREVAQLAGVAPITASRVLNSPELVSEEIRERVQAAIKQTGYVPNRLAGGLASSRSRLIAAVVPTIAVSVFLDTVESLTNTLFEGGYQLMLGQTGYSDQREDDLLEAIIGRRPDGIVLTGVVHSQQSRTRLLASGIPVVETWDLTPDPIDMVVGFSHIEIGTAVSNFLVDRQRKQFALITADDERARRRARAFQANTVARGLGDVMVVEVGASRTLQSGREAMSRILAQRPDVDAVFCSSDLLALGVIAEATARRISIPEQLAVVGFGDFSFVADMIPALTTVRVNGAAIGQQAARFLMDIAGGQPVEQRVVDVGFSIVERDSA